MTAPMRNKILDMIGQGFTNAEIIAATGSSSKYVIRLRWERNTKGKQPIPQPTYATPRPCGPFEELAWKVREREARRRELVLGMLA